ncbi:MAG: Asp-tRNA(Asn)/Glu-tRNA(Gln) amidotransferase subunit GatB [Opitutales bacterium]|nr:Asp-tRNA(Asn)/Glu-tRNA(Gln) amidotransferase subunit GatB [Opitutales bacterium]
MSDYEAVIGLEVHVQLKTKSKMFTDAPYYYGAEPNTLTNPVVLGMPGTLPVLNKEAIEKTIQVGLMLGCKIPEVSKWDRKHYFYPDMPKNYQISQYDQPLCEGGAVEIEMLSASRNVMGDHREIALTRIHLEEDVGKLTHTGEMSLVDYNRAGAPLIEIVTEPDIFSPDEAFAFLTALRNNLQFAGMSDCDMEKGQMRCDANVSVRPKGSEKLGTKVELKNLNSISGVRNGLEYEIKRQIHEVKAGGIITQETRRWDADQNMTYVMRTKEEAHDYRYFPCPDLMPIRISEEWKSSLGEALPELPFDRQRRYMEDLKLPYTVTSVLCPNRDLCEFFEAALAVHNNAKGIANILVNNLLSELSEASFGDDQKQLSDLPITPEGLAELIKLVDDAVISNQIAKEVFSEMIQTGKTAGVIVDEKGLKQSSDTGELEGICADMIDANPKAVEQFKAGQEKAINAIKGGVMKATQGKANPKLVDKILREMLS